MGSHPSGGCDEIRPSGDFQRSAERKSRARRVMIVPLWHRGIIAIKMKQFVGVLLASVCMATCPGCKPAPELEVTITPPKVTIPDNSKRGTQLATVSVRWSDGAVFTGDVRLTKNPSGICQLSRIAERGNSLTAATRMELQLGRDTTKADDYTIPVCTVTAFKEGDGH